MRSTFMGLETARRGLFTQQSALYTTGHNISNANTIGYSRQRVNMDATIAYKAPNLNTATQVGQLGTGVEAGSIQRMRDQFIDRRFRMETSQFGYWDTRAKAMHEMEDVIDATSDFNLKSSFNNFWKGVQDVANTPEKLSVRRVMITDAEQLVDAFVYTNAKLKEIQRSQAKEMDAMQGQVNSILSKIADLNEQIQKIEPIGQIPNDLYDARDTLIDQLNDIIPVEVQRLPLEGLAKDPAEGGVKITLKGAPGTKPVELVNGRKYAAIQIPAVEGKMNNVQDDSVVPFDYMKISDLKDRYELVDTPHNMDANAPWTQSNFSAEEGRLLSLINAHGYKKDGTGEVLGAYPAMLKDIDKMAREFINAFNDQHKEGWTLEEKNTDGTVKTPSKKGEDFFVVDGNINDDDIAARFKVSEDISKNPSLLAATGTSESKEGNNENALKLAQLYEKRLPGLDNYSLETFYQGVTGEMATKAQDAVFKADKHGIQLLAETNNRASVSSVSLDEEMTGLITFQQAYNASARMITVVDETLDKIINGMGRVGL